MIRLYDKNNSPQRLEEIVRILNDGGIIIYPTDTTYALGCHALKERAVERICKIKMIDPKKHPLSIVCRDLSEISHYAKVDNDTYKILRQNLPGNFTFILPAAKSLPKVFRNRNEKEVGIKIIQRPLVNSFLEVLNAPLMTASLPIGDDEMEYLTNPELIEEKFGSSVDIIIDGGEGMLGESTIVNCLDEKPEIIRQGLGELV